MFGGMFYCVDVFSVCLLVFVFMLCLRCYVVLFVDVSVVVVVRLFVWLFACLLV